MTVTKRTLAFFGASTGVGLAALHLSVAEGHTCVALLRDPSKLDAVFPLSTRPSNLILKQGNAHDEAAVASCLTDPNEPQRLVDAISFSIGAVPVPLRMTIDDPDVCKKGMATVLVALKNLRSDKGAKGDPLIVAVSTIGHSRFQRDVALFMVPIYATFVRVPGADKQVMEDRIVESGEKNFVVVRASHLTDGERQGAAKVRVGIEDMQKGVEHTEIGVSISRREVGGWIFEKLLNVDEVEPQYRRKALSLTW